MLTTGTPPRTIHPTRSAGVFVLRETDRQHHAVDLANPRWIGDPEVHAVQLHAVVAERIRECSRANRSIPRNGRSDIFARKVAMHADAEILPDHHGLRKRGANLPL